MDPQLPTIIGLTGGIASGKSTVASFLTRMGVPVVDADQVSRQITTPGSPVMEEIIRIFGRKYVNPDGTLDRAGLGTLVFSNPAALKQLEEITHPAINGTALALFRDLGTRGHRRVVYEATLILEHDLVKSMNMAALIVTHMDKNKRMNILRNIRQMSPLTARQRINAQLPDQDRIARADYLINTSGTLEETEKETRDVWKAIVERFG